MTARLLTLRTIVTMDPSLRVIHDGGIIIRGNTIERVLDAGELQALRGFDGEIEAATTLTAIPGFVQTHIHLCQTLFRGMADDLELLDWLKGRIFPLEAAHSPDSMYASARCGIAELIRSGTTTILDMGSIHHEEEIVRAIHETGLRAFVGKALMDVNGIMPDFKEPTEQALGSALREAERWHGSSEGRIRYAVAPRFILSCSEPLLKEAYAMTKSFPGMLFHTHAAENRGEMEAVRQRCAMGNIEYFETMGILHANTCLAHCIWLNDDELSLLAERQAKVLHCPSSNSKLGSGVARIPEMRRRGITISLGADGAPCNNTLDMFHEMRMAALIQKPLHGPTAMDARAVFAMATVGGAEALGLDQEIGSIEAGKKADIVLLNLDRAWNPVGGQDIDGPYSSIVYSSSPENVVSVMVNGKWLYNAGSFLALDEPRVVEAARTALHQLTGRIRS